MNPSPAETRASDRRQARSQRSFNSLVFGAVAVGFLTLVAVGALAASVMAQNFNFTGLVAHTYEVESSISDFRILDERIEAARRGYLLSRDERFASGVQTVRGQIDAGVDRIRKLTLDNPQQQANVAALRKLLDQQVQAIDVSIAFARGGADDSSAFYEDTGVATTRALRAQTDRMLALERTKLAQRDRARRASIDRLVQIAIGAGLLLLAVGVGSLLVILRYTRDLTASRAELSTLNRDLEAQVATRTADLSTSNARLEALLREVNHRVANSLQLVSAFVQMQASALEGESRAALKDTQRRIEAIIQVHRRLYSSGDVESVDMREYLNALVRELQDTLSSPASPRRLSLVAEPVRLATDQAVSVGVIVNELVTNACKYAYKRGEAGEVRIRLADGGDGLTLSVEDDGPGLTAGAAAHGTGLGGRLIKAMAVSLSSQVVYDPAHAGVRASLRLPTA
ncbi:sensor histidine kinase [Phenylobacterium sp.]|uniref:sensor histidine kinase n=1 Tax=Phenylobacterium sp. TaxID=1871053 RepID=UPI002E36E20C|nr:histidine kinase dimerization/phosphoacceptor domain -containing protein [Phenylobacterium sp.]HEX3367054.1 histidine kinase dimerization/phosphoacceptor domain -containing protein [Phenylobacterium sp.]